MKTAAKRLDVSYTPKYVIDTLDGNRGALPESVWVLDDGRVLAVYEGGREHLYASRNALAEVHPCSWRDGDETREVDVPGLPATLSIDIDWAEVHHLCGEIDRARRAHLGDQPRIQYPVLGYDGLTDAFGGTYVPLRSYETLPGLISRMRGVDRIARDAWELVHGGGKRPDIEDARQACRVAIACSAWYEMLYRVGLLQHDPATRICGTGPGYGLTGLGWLAGHRVDREYSREEVEAFAAGGDLTPAAGAQRGERTVPALRVAL